MEKLESYSYKEIIDMDMKDFDEALSKSTMNVGALEGMRKMLSANFDEVKEKLEALTFLRKKGKLPEGSEEEATEVTRQMIAIAYSLENKATKLYDRYKELLGIEVLKGPSKKDFDK